MIPHRSPGRDNSGNGVSCRVEACRRRLRAIRATHKSPANAVEVLNSISFSEAGAEKAADPSLESVLIGLGLRDLKEAGIT